MVYRKKEKPSCYRNKNKKQSFSGKDYHLLVSSTACERVVFPEIMLWPVTVDRGVVLRAPLLDKADRKAVVQYLNQGGFEMLYVVLIGLILNIAYLSLTLKDVKG